MSLGERLSFDSNINRQTLYCIAVGISAIAGIFMGYMANQAIGIDGLGLIHVTTSFVVVMTAAYVIRKVKQETAKEWR